MRLVSYYKFGSQVRILVSTRDANLSSRPAKTVREDSISPSLPSDRDRG